MSYKSVNMNKQNLNENVIEHHLKKLLKGK